MAVEADFEVVLTTAVALQQIVDGVAEVAFDFEHQSGSFLPMVVSLPAEELFGEGLHAGRSLAGADGSDHGDSGEEPFLGEDKPVGGFGFDRLGAVMGFADHQRDRFILAGGRPGRERPASAVVAAHAGKPDLPHGKEQRSAHAGCGPRREIVPADDAVEEKRIVQLDHIEERIRAGAGKRLPAPA